MSWSDLKITQETVEGYLPRSLYDRETGGVDASLITSGGVSRAKRDVVNALTRQIAVEMQRIGTAEEFMDVLEGITALESYLQDALVTAWAKRYFIEQDMTADKFDLADRAKSDFSDAVDALVEWVKASDAIDDELDDEAGTENVRLDEPLWAI